MNNIDSEVNHFFSTMKKASSSFGQLPFDRNLKMTPPSKIPWFEFFIPEFPLNAIFKEVQAIKSLFVDHRDGEVHRGWKSICLHGLSAKQTMCYFDYGLKKEDAHYNWTEIAPFCPTTVEFFKTYFPAESYERIRFMLVEPGGYVSPHRDRNESSLGPLSIALNAPPNCNFGIEGHGLIPIQPGGFYLIDLSNRHSVFNQSNVDRFHITVEAHHGSHFYKYMLHLLKTYERKHPLRRFLNKDYYFLKRKIYEEAYR